MEMKRNDSTFVSELMKITYGSFHRILFFIDKTMFFTNHVSYQNSRSPGFLKFKLHFKHTKILR